MSSKKNAMKKIVVTSAKLTFEAGTRLGLDTLWATRHRSFIKAVADTEHEYDVATRVSFPKGAALWVEFKGDKAVGATGEYEVSEMPRAYLEEDPQDVEKRQKMLAPPKKPAKSKAA